MNIGIYTSPFILMYVYKRGFFTTDEMKSLGRFFGGLTCILVVSLFMRAIGRTRNEKYAKFIQSLRSPMTDPYTHLNAIRKYDFDFNAWPVTYTVTNRER